MRRTGSSTERGAASLSHSTYLPRLAWVACGLSVTRLALRQEDVGLADKQLQRLSVRRSLQIKHHALLRAERVKRIKHVRPP